MSKRKAVNKSTSNKKIKEENPKEDNCLESIGEKGDNNQKIDVKSETNNVFGCDRISKSGEKFGLKVMSWNVSGLRALLKKDGLKAIDREDADIVCLQEIKCDSKTFPEEINVWNKYRYKYHNFGQTKGYSGVSLFSKTKPLNVTKGIGIEEHDSEGRVITAEFDDFFLVTTYVPNSGRGLVRLNYRQKWNSDFEEYLVTKNSEKPVIVCGDLNVSHKEIDLENPKTNTKTAGFTKEEREDFSRLLTRGFIDSFRELYPNKNKCYTFWSYLRNARQKDIGWRLDYFVISNNLVDKLCDNQIRSQVMGSDHCPIVLYIALNTKNQ